MFAPYNLYKRQIESIAVSLAQQPEPWGDECYYKYLGSNTN